MQLIFKPNDGNPFIDPDTSMNLTEIFAERLNTLRKQRLLTVQELAASAGVPPSLVSGLQSGNRVIGEFVARKLAKALHLDGEESESFVYLAINGCSEKVLQSSKRYPAELLNLIAGELLARGISPDRISHCIRKPQFSEADAALYLDDGNAALINVQVSFQ
jgi:transcriptional regulator with XRE-family HTH domain